MFIKKKIILASIGVISILMVAFFMNKQSTLLAKKICSISIIGGIGGERTVITLYSNRWLTSAKIMGSYDIIKGKSDRQDVQKRIRISNEDYNELQRLTFLITNTVPPNNYSNVGATTGIIYRFQFASNIYYYSEIHEKEIQEFTQAINRINNAY